MSILCTFPGRHGDLFWALPTVRAISEQAGEPVDLQICGEFAGLIPLLEAQPYLARIVADSAWGIGAGWQPPNREDVISPYAATYHLGYRRWPELPLPEETYTLAAHEMTTLLAPLDLGRPWIQTPKRHSQDWFYHRRTHWKIAVGFTECWFELKYGLMKLVEEHDIDWHLESCMGGGRWFTEAGEGSHNWVEAAELISQADLLLGDCSALHVLAVGMGVPVVMVEPMEARWNPIFYPCGKAGGQVTLVIGGDGQPTFDARHTCDTLEARLANLPARGR
jgi:hypothetical protein